jgi:hypothetical protein
MLTENPEFGIGKAPPPAPSPRGRGLLCALALALAAPGCGGSGAGTKAEMPEAGEILKIAYYRAYQDPRTKQLEATYRVVMSNSWKDRVGESPRDGLVKAAPRKLYSGFLTDAEMAKYLALLREFGIEQLPPVDPETLKPEEIQRLALDPKTTSFTRIITIGTDKWQRCYLYSDVHRPGSEKLIPIFTKCEALVTRIVEYSIQTRIYTDRTVMPKDR